MNIEISPKEYEHDLNWHDANLYCKLLTIDGKDDWRLPTLEELIEIYDSEHDLHGSFYWSSTEGNGYGAWSQKASDGCLPGYEIKYVIAYVRAVRTI